MTKTNSFSAKLFVGFVATAMLFTLSYTPARAATADELQAQITALMAQIAALQGGSTTTGGSCHTFTMDLTMGASGAEVTALQTFLMANGQTIAAGATGYFGGQTQAALASFQSANGIAPAAGYFGPITRAKVNAMCTPSGDDSSDDSSDDDSSDDDSSSTDLSGEASLKSFEVNDGDDNDDVEEGGEDLAVADMNVEFEDGDAKITRLDIALVDEDSPTEPDAWKVFDTVTLWVDGEEVASMDATDKDNYLDEDDGTIRFSGLDIVGMEDEELTITVGVSVQNSVDGAGTDANWSVNAEAVRFIDAEDVTTTDSDTDDLNSSGFEKAEFTIDEEGAGDSLDLETSSEDPDAHTIALDEDNNVEESIFAFELSAEDSDGDVTLDNLITINVTVATTSASSDMDTLVNDFRLEIDGESFSAESYSGTGLTAAIDFDIDGDVVIDADSVATAVLFADFNEMDNADEGSTIFASVAPADIDAESADGITVGGSTRTGETHTLRTQGLDLGDVTDGTDSSDSTQVVSGVATDANYGTMFLTYEITAFGDNLFVKANDAIRGASSTAGVAFTIEDSSNGTATTSGAVSVSYDIEGADENGGYFELEDGETYEMTVTVNSYNPVGVGGTYNLQVLSVGFNDSEATANDSEAPSDLNDYESDAVAVQS